MKNFIARLHRLKSIPPPFVLVICLLFCFYSQSAAQVRVRRGIHLPELRHKDSRSPKSSHTPKKVKLPELTVVKVPKVRPGAIDEYFYVKWNNDRPLSYNDFKYNRNLYNKFVPDRDTDLINEIYPDYIAFYNRLKKRIESDPAPVINEEQDERIERLLKLKTDSLEKGYITQESLDIDLSFTISIDSPAASIINLTPVIYATGDNEWYFNITPVFSKSDSWMMVKSEDIRQHEQIHFDIFELFARKMRKHLWETLRKNYGNTAYDMSTEITPAYELLYQQLNQMQLEFDKQTGALTATNAPLTKTNALWVKEIRSQLDALGNFVQPEGTIILK